MHAVEPARVTALRPPRVLPDADGPKYAPHGRSRSFRGATMAGIEWDEWKMVQAFVRPSHVVLEFGARFGTTSCALARSTANRGTVVAVEPDPAAHEHLSSNVLRNRCNVSIVKGTVGSATPLSFVSFWSYASYTKPASAGEATVPNVRLAALEAHLGVRFNAVLLDCEGCIGAFFGPGGDGRAMLAADHPLRLILMEEDGDNRRVEYDGWYATFRSHGFRRVWQSHDTYNQSWSRTLVHSAWARGPLESNTPTCEAFAAREQLARHEVACMGLEDWPQPRLVRPCARMRAGHPPPGAAKLDCQTGSSRELGRSWVRGY